MPQAAELHYAIDIIEPVPCSVGLGNVLHLRGWCLHPRQRVRRLALVVNNQAQRVTEYGLKRPDVWQAFRGHTRHPRQAYYCGFRVTVPLAPRSQPEELSLTLQATLQNGEILQHTLPSLTVWPTLRRDPLALPLKIPSAAEGPLVAICLATHCPPLALFERQLQSLLGQSLRNWICLVSDDASPPETRAEIARLLAQDERFSLLPAAPERLGFYRNFERCLSFVPPAAEYVALADQDDYWYPQKLSTLFAQFAPGITLAYSDMKLVDEVGQVLFETYWTMRRNNSTDLAAFLMKNSVTGASSMFRRELLVEALPFPPELCAAYHDHWIGSVALAKGQIAYVPYPLYDYTRHGGNITEYHAAPRGAWHQRFFWLIKNLLTAQGSYFAFFAAYELLLRTVVMSRLLSQRCATDLTPEKGKALRRLSKADTSVAIWLWLFWLGLKNWRTMNATDGAEYELLLGILWRRLLALRTRLGRPAASSEPNGA